MSRKRTRNDTRLEQAEHPPGGVETAPEVATANPHRNGESTGRPAPTTRSTRRISQMRVAQSRAAHFARPDVEEGHDTETGIEAEQEHWPGPFSTAMRMIEDRENARLNRETNIARKMNNSNNYDANTEEEDVDEYDMMLKESRAKQWGQRLEKPILRHQIPSLVELSMKILADNFSLVSELGDLPSELRSLIALEVSKRRKLDGQALMAIIPEVVSSVIIPDCSAISESDIQACFNNSVLFLGSDGERSKLQVLSLHNCGYCFTDAVATSLVSSVRDLEVLSLRGCFRLTDKGLSMIVSSALQLRSIDLACSLRLASDGLMAISSLCSLCSLCLDNIVHLTDADLELLATPSFQNLNSLSIQGLTRISDKSVIKLIKICGLRLTSLNISDCVQLGGEVLSTLRIENPLLAHLNISNLSKLSTADLLMFFSHSEFNGADVSSIPSTNRARAGFQSIQVNNLNSLVDDVVIQLCSSSSNSLSMLELGGCAKLTGRMAMAIVRHCAGLKHLDISFLRNVQEHAMFYIISHCPLLAVLNVWGCSQLSSSFYRHCCDRSIDVSGFIIKGQ